MRSLERWAILLDGRQAGNRHWLASQGLSVVLDLESSSWPTRAAILSLFATGCKVVAEGTTRAKSAGGAID
jgi:hypothetical protein